MTLPPVALPFGIFGLFSAKLRRLQGVPRLRSEAMHLTAGSTAAL
jgi:hypothetical protein